MYRVLKHRVLQTSVVIFILLVGFSSIITAHPAQQAVNCPGAPVSRLVVGESGLVGPKGANNVRSEPKTDAGRLGQIPGGGLFIVLEGPTCAGGLAWWRVDYNGLIGWTAEGQGADYWLEPTGALPTQAPTVTAFPTATSEFPLGVACPGFMPSRLIVGEQGQVVPGPANNLRANPTADAQRLREIPGGSRFLVLEGPVCAGGLAWWRVDYYGTVGWTPEGSKDVYWLEPAGPLPTQAPTLTPTITPTPYPTSTPAPTYTPVPPMPPMRTFGNLGSLLNQPLPDTLQPITVSNVNSLQPLSIIGQGNIQKMMVAPDGKTVAIVTSLGVWLRQLEATDQPGRLLDLPELQVTSAAFSPDSQLLALGGFTYQGMERSALEIVDVTTGKNLSLTRVYDRAVTEMVFSPNGAWLGLAYNDSVSLLNLDSLQTWDVPMGIPVNQISFNADSTLLAASDGHTRISIYSLAVHQHQISYEVDWGLRDILFSADNQFFFAAGDVGFGTQPGILRIWDLSTSKRIESPRFADGVNKLALTADGKQLVVASTYHHKFWVLDAATQAQQAEFDFLVDVTNLTFAPDGKLIASHTDGTVRQWNISSGENKILLTHPTIVADDWTNITADGKPLALAEVLPQDAEALRTQANSFYSRGFYNSQAGYSIMDTKMAPDGSMILVKHPQSVVIWDASLRLPLTNMRCFGEIVGFSADGTVLMTQTGDQALWLWGIPQ